MFLKSRPSGGNVISAVGKVSLNDSTIKPSKKPFCTNSLSANRKENSSSDHKQENTESCYKKLKLVGFRKAKGTEDSKHRRSIKKQEQEK